jgi:hypothetical protein
MSERYVNIPVPKTLRTRLIKAKGKKSYPAFITELLDGIGAR